MLKENTHEMFKSLIIGQSVLHILDIQALMIQSERKTSDKTSIELIFYTYTISNIKGRISPGLEA